MAEGEFALVRENLERAVGRGGMLLGDHDIYAMLVDAVAQQRDVNALQKYAPLAEEAAARFDHKLYKGVAHRAWGVLHRLTGDYAGAETRLQQALEIFQKLDTRWQQGRTLFELGELAKSQGRRAAAHDYFSLAVAAFDDMGAVPDVNRARTALQSLS
jgi:tetratricopeptide (TPR) repeat protein